MKWWLWLILELLILIGTGVVVYFYDCDILAAGIIGFAILCLVDKIRQIIPPEKVK